jgi:hypothetical protein
MIAALRTPAADDPAAPARQRARAAAQAFAAFYGIAEQRLARHLGVALA